MLSFQFDQEEQKLVCIFCEKMNSENSPLVTQKIETKLHELEQNSMISTGDSGKYDRLKIIFDLEEVNFVASAFMRTCIIFARKIQPGNFSIINSQPVIKKTFMIAGLDNLIEIS